MGQKTNPVGFRLAVTRNWESQWFDEKKFGKMLNEDLLIKKYVRKRIPDGAISSVKIERTPKKVLLELNTARPGVVIGKKGAEIDKVKEELKKLINKEVQINIKEIKHPELDAMLISQNIARQLEGKVSFRRAMKRGVTSAIRFGALGVKVAHPDRPVVALSGDGSAMYSIQALWTAAHHDLEILFVIISNREYRVLKHNLDVYRQRFDAQSDRPYPHMDLTDPVLGFVEMARGMGVQGRRARLTASSRAKWPL